MDGESIVVEMDADQPLVALAFKVQLFEGRRHVFTRVYRGTLVPGMNSKEASKRITGAAPPLPTELAEHEP